MDYEENRQKIKEAHERAKVIMKEARDLCDKREKVTDLDSDNEMEVLQAKVDYISQILGIDFDIDVNEGSEHEGDREQYGATSTLYVTRE